MRLHRFYTSEKIGDKKELTINSADLANQIVRVFRLGKGDRVVVFDGSGNDFECELREVKPRGEISVEIKEVRPSRFIPKRKIYLFQAIIKKDNFEWVVEKATELGVTDIVPVLAEHSEKKSLNFERLNKIATEASEQCGRGDVPVVHEVATVEQATTATARPRLEKLSAFDCEKVAMNLEGENFFSSRLNLTESSTLIGVFIGPEGGWSPKELEMFHANNISVYSLGKQVLRAETAAIATLSRVVF